MRLQGSILPRLLNAKKCVAEVRRSHYKRAPKEESALGWAAKGKVRGEGVEKTGAKLVSYKGWSTELEGEKRKGE